MSFPKLGRGPLIAGAVFVLFEVVTRCDTIHPEEVDCEDAVAYLQKCCPAPVSSAIHCIYTPGNGSIDLGDSPDGGSAAGPSGGCAGPPDRAPDISEATSTCIRGKSCTDLVDGGICSEAFSGIAIDCK